MAEVTTVEGYQYIFDPKVVTIITDRDASTGQTVTGVYGITAAVVRIAETPDDFMSRLKIVGKFVKLTRPNASPIWINAAAVSSLRLPLENEYVDDVKTVVAVGKTGQGVTEAIDVVRPALNSRGANL